MPTPSSHSAAQGLSSLPTQQQPYTYGTLNPSLPTSFAYPPSAYPYVQTQPQTTDPGLTYDPHLYVQPLPDDFWSLSWKERRHLEKMRADQLKMAKEWSNANKEWDKAQSLDAKRRYKAEMKQKKKDLK